MSEDRSGGLRPRRRWLAAAEKLIGASDLSAAYLFARAAFGSLLVTASATAFGLANAVLLGRMLGPAGYGVYSLALTIVSTLFIGLFTGLSTLLMREIAVARGLARPDLISRILRWAHVFGLTCAAIVFLGILLTVLCWRAQLDEEAFRALLVASIMLPLGALVLIETGALRGLGYIVLSLLPDQIVRPGILFAAILLVWGLSLGITPSGALALHVLAFVASFLLSGAILGKVWLSQTRGSVSLGRIDVGPWFAALLPLTTISGLQTASSYADVLMLGALSSDKEVGLYRVAAQVGLLISSLVAVMQVTVQPRIAELFGRSEKAALQALLTRSSRGMMIVAVPLAACVSIWSSELLQAAFGVEYVGASAALTILAMGQLLPPALGSASNVLNMTAHEHDTLIGFAIGLITNLLLGFALIPRLGINGAAVAVIGSLAISHAYMASRVHKRVGVNCTIFAGIRLDAFR